MTDNPTEQTLPTELPAPDHTRLLAMYRDEMRALDSAAAGNPASAYHGMTADRIEDRRREVRAFLIERGIADPGPLTPEQVAEQKVEARWTPPETPVQDQLENDEIAREATLHPVERRENIAALKAEFGDARYNDLVEQAKVTLKPGETLPEAAVSNRFVLLNKAAQGRFIAAHERARAAAKPKH